MTDPIGPCMAGGFQDVVGTDASGQYTIQYLPDLHNSELQAEGKPACYYYMPATVRLARNPKTNDYKFRLLHFVGIQKQDSHVGVEATREIAGGLITFSTTTAFPPDVMKQAEEQLLDRCRGKSDKYWGWEAKASPTIRPVIITESTTTLTNLKPNADGTPAAVPENAEGGGEGGDAEGGGEEGADRTVRTRRMSRGIRLVGTKTRLPQLRRRDATNLDPWYWNLQGQGKSSIVIPSENAFSGLIGTLPTAILWESFHGAYGGISVAQAMKLKVWSPLIYIKIEGEWDSIFQHFSASAKGHYLFASGDIKAELNDMVTSGGIKVTIEQDPTIPGGPGKPEDPSERIDLVLKEFMKQAQERIFTPVPNVPPAEASEGERSSFHPWGVSFALKYRRDTNKLKLFYEERKVQAYLQENVIGGTLEGFYDEIKADEGAEKKYFGTLYLDEWDRKVTRFVSPAINWPDPSDRTSGDPVHAVAVSIGYPDTKGAKQWDGKIFLQNPNSDEAANWKTSFTRKDEAHVSKPPKDWAPDVTYIRRMIEFANPPRNDPYTRFFIEKKKVELDPPGGTPWTDNYVDFAIEDAGRLDRTFYLGGDIENAKQMVLADVQAYEVGNAAAKKRPVTSFLWQYADADKPRRLVVYGAQPGIQFGLRYRVTVKVKGGLLTKGMQWTGPWVENDVSEGELFLEIPRPNDPGVTKRSLVPEREHELELPVFTPEVPVGVTAGGNGKGTTNGEGEEGEPPGVATRRVANARAKAAGRISGYDTEPEDKVVPERAGRKAAAVAPRVGRSKSRDVGEDGEDVDDPNRDLKEESADLSDEYAANWTTGEPPENGDGAIGERREERERAADEADDELAPVWTAHEP